MFMWRKLCSICFSLKCTKITTTEEFSCDQLEKIMFLYNYITFKQFYPGDPIYFWRIPEYTGKTT